MDRHLRQLLPIDAFHDVLLAGVAVTDGDEETRDGVAGDGAAEDDGGDGEVAVFVVDPPRRRAEGELEEGVAIKEDDDSDEEPEREGVVCLCFVGLVEGMGTAELGLMVLQSCLLFWGQHGELQLLFRVFWVGIDGPKNGSIPRGKIVAVVKFR